MNPKTMKRGISGGRSIRGAAFRTLVSGLFLLFLTLCATAEAWAASFPDAASAIPLTFVGGDLEEDGYRYEQVGTGIGFDTLMMEDEPDAYFGLFEIDDGVYYELWQNGRQIPYVSGDIIFEQGSFQLLIAPSESQRESYFSIFSFKLQELIPTLERDTITVSYVNAYEMFGFSTDGEALFMLSVPNGGVSTEAVNLALVSEDVFVEEVYFNAKKQSDATQRTFSEPGSYLIKLRVSISSEYWLAFRVLSSADCAMTFWPLPDGISCLSSSDAQLAGTTLYLPRDGTYRLHLSCRAFDSEKNWVESLERDTTLPGVCFSESVSSGRVRRRMRVTALSPDARITVYLDDLPQPLFDGSFAEDGRYRVIVSDRAGNTQEFLFALYQFDKLFLTLAGLVGALCVALVLSKKGLDYLVKS